MTRLSVLLALAAVAVVGTQALRAAEPYVDLDGLAADAPAWLDQLTDRAD